MTSSTFLLSATAILVLAACVMAAGTSSCSSITGPAYYSELPKTCSNVSACYEARCTCSGLTWAEGTCTGSASCTGVDNCYRAFYNCINKAAYSASAAEGETCNTWGAAIATEALSYVALSLNASAHNQTFTAYIATNLYKACAYDACYSVNTTHTGGVAQCEPKYAFICQKPADAPTNPPAPVPPTPPAAPDEPTQAVTIALRFPGNFIAFFGLDEAARQAVCDKFGEAIRNKTGAPAGKTICIEGSLVVNYEVVLPTSAVEATTAIEQNAANINEDSSTDWLADATAAIETACTTCDTVTAPAVDTVVTPVVTPAPGPPTVEQTCGSGCIAGIIIAVAVIVIVIISVACICSGKSNKGDGQHEPVELANKV